MAKTATRLKQAAPLHPVPQSRDEANDAIRKIGIAQRERARIQADMQDVLAGIKESHEAQAQPYKEQIEQLSAGVHTWCEANREQLTQGGKVKYANLPAGEVKWRTRPPRVTIRAAEVVLDTLRRLGLIRFIRAKEEVNKEAMLAEPEAVSGIAGVKIEQGEDFVIVPFETALEEVA
ncbi:MAG: host-nuclease inhibitor Gam family protein [Sulfuricellaceae bacterium]|nr:host-nuclease inhibitor Gam family protein [Sulfuricellaceae bacterium]